MREEIKEIIETLGGTNRLVAMLGACNMTYDNKRLSFKFQFKMCRNANICVISLDEDKDLYNVEFFQYKKKDFSCPSVKKFEGIYNESLKSVFEEFTGLVLNL